MNMNTTDMKRYKSSEWNFMLDIPKRWNSFPPVSANSPYEVIRFASQEDGTHLLIIFRFPHDTKQTLSRPPIRCSRFWPATASGTLPPLRRLSDRERH